MEALAAGVPALCRTDDCLTGVIREGENGWQYRDERDFMNKLDWFRRHPDHWAELGRQAAASAVDFSAETFAARLEAIYRDRVARHTPRREASA